MEAFPMAVTKVRFPNTVQLGDINGIDGARIEPVDIICAGSPCQNLSVAGNREGLKGEQSGLFLRAIDVVRRMRSSTGGRYPRWFVWENDPGAFSSNKGMDFRAVLEKIGEAEIPMPASGKWAEAGVVELQDRQIAWRVLDAQYWGVPQRRKRIFLVADFRGRRAGEILFECEGVPWDSSESSKSGEGSPAGTEDSLGDAGGGSVKPSSSVVRMRAGCRGVVKVHWCRKKNH